MQPIGDKREFIVINKYTAAISLLIKHIRVRSFKIEINFLIVGARLSHQYKEYVDDINMFSFALLFL